MLRRSYQELRAAVKRGIELLDTRFPDWRVILQTRKKRKRYDFCNACQCVLGTVGSTQLTGVGDNWTRGQNALGIKGSTYGEVGNGTSKYYGFDWLHSEEELTLTKLWDKAIKTGKV